MVTKSFAFEYSIDLIKKVWSIAFEEELLLKVGFERDDDLVLKIIEGSRLLERLALSL